MTHSVRVEPFGVDIEVDAGETLFNAAWRAGYRWPTVCYGQARCTRCHVIVTGGEEDMAPVSDPDEQAALMRLRRLLYRDAAPCVRLACRLRVTGGVVVEQKEFRGERCDP